MFWGADSALLLDGGCVGYITLMPVKNYECVNSNTFPLHTHIQPIYWFFDGMREINNNVICSVLFKYKCAESDKQEIKLVWPYLCINRDIYENCNKKASDNMDECFTSFMHHCNTHTNTCN